MAPAIAPAPPVSAPTPTAVVVDDSASIRALLRHALTIAGYDVVAEGQNGAEALTLYEQHRPTLIMLDIVLPVMDGIAAATALLARHPSAQVIMCSSLAARDRILACRAAGVLHFVLKPFDVLKVADIARKVAERQVPATPREPAEVRS